MLVIATWALVVGRLPIAFVAVSTMVLAFVPMIVARRLGISLPIPFLVATAAFLFGSIFLGEATSRWSRFDSWDAARSFLGSDDDVAVVYRLGEWRVVKVLEAMMDAQRSGVLEL